MRVETDAVLVVCAWMDVMCVVGWTLNLRRSRRVKSSLLILLLQQSAVDWRCWSTEHLSHKPRLAAVFVPSHWRHCESYFSLILFDGGHNFVSVEKNSQLNHRHSIIRQLYKYSYWLCVYVLLLSCILSTFIKQILQILCDVGTCDLFCSHCCVWIVRV